MALISLGSAGWAETEDDSSFRMSMRGPVSREDAFRLGPWLLDHTSTTPSQDEGSSG